MVLTVLAMLERRATMAGGGGGGGTTRGEEATVGVARRQAEEVAGLREVTRPRRESLGGDGRRRGRGGTVRREEAAGGEAVRCLHLCEPVPKPPPPWFPIGEAVRCSPPSHSILSMYVGLLDVLEAEQWWSGGAAGGEVAASAWVLGMPVMSSWPKHGTPHRAVACRPPCRLSRPSPVCRPCRASLAHHVVCLGRAWAMPSRPDLRRARNSMARLIPLDGRNDDKPLTRTNQTRARGITSDAIGSVAVSVGAKESNRPFGTNAQD